MKILVFGKYGQLAQSINEVIKGYSDIPEITFLSSGDFNFINPKISISDLIQGFDLIIITSAFTDVEKAEEIKNHSNLKDININTPFLICMKAAEIGIKVIIFSSDYVFDGRLECAYDEAQITNPQNKYGESKAIMEDSIKKLNNVIIFRVSWLFSKAEKSFYSKILEKLQSNEEFSVVGDQVGSPTSSNQFAKFLIDNHARFLEDDFTGIYHFHGYPYVSWYDFAFEIAKKNNLNTKIIKKISSKTLKEYKAKRPSNSCLKSTRIDLTGLNDWREDI